jgi:hypothetical protein
LTFVDDYRAIEKLSFKPERRTNHQYRNQLSTLRNESSECRFNRFEQRILLKKVVIGICGYAQLGEQCERGIRLGSTTREAQNPFNVEFRIGDADEWNTDACTYKPM